MTEWLFFPETTQWLQYGAVMATVLWWVGRRQPQEVVA